MKRTNSATLTGLFTAIASSLCCILPAVAFFAGTSSLAASFSWIEPARPFLLAATGLALGFAWYRQLKPQSVDGCGCQVPEKRSFMQTRSFLVGITLLAVMASSFPLYANWFFPKANTAALVPNEQYNLKTVELEVKGMTCASCENHVRAEIQKLPGIFEVAVSYENGITSVQFDDQQTNSVAIQNAIDATGYSVVHQKIRTQ